MPDEYWNYIKPELVILTPVLTAVGTGLKKSSKKISSRISSNDIPIWLLVIGIILAFFYMLGTSTMETQQEWFMAIFTAIVQGALSGWGAVGLHQTIKQKSKIM